MNMTNNIFVPVDEILQHIDASMLAVSPLLGDYRASYKALGNGTAKRRRRERKLTLAKALKQASKAGQRVSGVVIEDGKIELKLGEAASGNGASTDVDRELAEFEARHAKT
jgi:hypothetical protein